MIVERFFKPPVLRRRQYMTLQRIPLTEAARRLKQIRQIAQDQGLVVLTSHAKPVLMVVEVERGKQLLEGV